jgi:fumarate reductase subunit C
MVKRTYVRSMDGWWHRDPFFLHYMAREATAVFVVIYAVILLVTLARLAQGEASFDDWTAKLAAAPSIALHVILLAAFLYHTWSWFRIMPKTMPPIRIGERRLGAAAITACGLAASILASAALLGILAVLAS